MRAAALYAHLAMSRFGTATAPFLLSRMPALLTWGARCSGKIRPPV